MYTVFHKNKLSKIKDAYWQFFTGWMPFLPPNQQRQSTETIWILEILKFYVAGES